MHTQKPLSVPREVPGSWPQTLATASSCEGIPGLCKSLGLGRTKGTQDFTLLSYAGDQISFKHPRGLRVNNPLRAGVASTLRMRPQSLSPPPLRVASLPPLLNFLSKPIFVPSQLQKPLQTAFQEPHLCRVYWGIEMGVPFSDSWLQLSMRDSPLCSYSKKKKRHSESPGTSGMFWNILDALLWEWLLKSFSLNFSPRSTPCLHWYSMRARLSTL